MRLKTNRMVERGRGGGGWSGEIVSEIQFVSTLLELKERNVLIKIYGWNFNKILFRLFLDF